MMFVSVGCKTKMSILCRECNRQLPSQPGQEILLMTMAHLLLYVPSAIPFILFKEILIFVWYFSARVSKDTWVQDIWIPLLN
jgi:hypothetical protein